MMLCIAGMKEAFNIKQSTNIVLLICLQSLTTSNACGVGNHDEHFYVSLCLFCCCICNYTSVLVDKRCVQAVMSPH